MQCWHCRFQHPYCACSECGLPWGKFTGIHEKDFTNGIVVTPGGKKIQVRIQPGIRMVAGEFGFSSNCPPHIFLEPADETKDGSFDPFWS